MCGIAQSDPAARRMLRSANITRKATIMLYTLAVILVILWLLGMVTSYTLGGFVHILLVVAIVVVLVRVITGRRRL